MKISHFYSGLLLTPLPFPASCSSLSLTPSTFQAQTRQAVLTPTSENRRQTPGWSLYDLALFKAIKNIATNLFHHHHLGKI